MLQIADEIDHDIESLKNAPLVSDISRADEVGAARKPVLTWTD